MVTNDPEMLEFVDRAVHIGDGRLHQLEEFRAAH
jgi:hypothetical protein